MNHQSCQLENVSGCSIVTLSPIANDLEWAEIESVGNQLISSLKEQAAPRALVDLTKMDYIGSSMVALIVRIWKTVENQNGQMVVANQHELVIEVLKLAGLTKVWTIVGTREEGMQKLGAKGGSASGGVGLTVLGLIFVIGAVIGLGILLSHSTILSEKVALIITFLFSALGIITGTLIVAKSAGAKKGLGIFLILASLAIVVTGVMKFPVVEIMSPPKTVKQTEDTKIKEENKKEDGNKVNEKNKEKEEKENNKKEVPGSTENS